MEKVRCTRNIDCFTKGNEYDYPDAINDVGEIRRLKGWSLFDMYFEKIETKEEVKKDQKEEYDLSTTITRAVKNNDPSIIAKEAGKSIDELCGLVDEKTTSCLSCVDTMYCSGLKCAEDKCPFSQFNGETKESAKAWLRGKFKQSLSGYEAVHVNTQEKWNFVCSKLAYTFHKEAFNTYNIFSCINLKRSKYCQIDYYDSTISFEKWLDLTGNTEGWLLFIGRDQFIREQTLLNLCVKNVAVTSEISDGVLPPKHILGYDTINGLTGSNNFIIGKYHYDKLTLTNDNCNRFDITKKEVIFVSLEEDDIVEYKALPVQHCSKVEFLTNEE